MKLISYILVLLLGTCWLLSTQEELVCADNAATCESALSDSSALKAPQVSNAHEHGDDLGACHFGHCGHIAPRISSMKLGYPAALGSVTFSPYLPLKTLETPFISYRPPAFS